MRHYGRSISALFGILLTTGWLGATPARAARAQAPRAQHLEDVAALGNIAANDNTVAGGHVGRGVLHIALVARRGLWFPQGPGTLGLPIESFGEAGRPLQIPGPLIRVPLGTRVVASIHNELGHALTIRGLAAPADAALAILRVPRGATRHTSFVLGRAGTFGYYGSDRGEPLESRILGDAELSGAIVVRAPHAPRLDHVFVLGLYDPVVEKGVPDFLYLLKTINGRSFPATERLTYERGQRVHWAVFNASAMVHPMHLHGFYFHVARADAYDEVTHAFFPGDGEELSWVAGRAGNWMFHCHITDHIARDVPLADLRARKAEPQMSIAHNPRVAVARRFHLPDQPMGGMVIAVAVRPRPGDAVAIPATAPRHLGLTIAAHDVAKPPYPGLTHDTLTLRDGPRASESSGNLGPPIVLGRGTPVAIAVTNRTREGTSIHWHGIALQDSYYDGGAGMGLSLRGDGMPMAREPGMRGSMLADRMSPPVEPGKTFVARFTPPDAGTFMYHAHMDDGWQLGSGIDGPLIVMPPGERFDPSTDHLVMISESYARAGSPFVAVNGALDSVPLVMTARVPQRLRIAVLTLGGEHLVISLCDGSRVLRWTPIAKDGRDLPFRLQRPETATQGLTIGETHDFRFTPARAGTLTLRIWDLDNNNLLVGKELVDVKTAQVASMSKRMP